MHLFVLILKSEKFKLYVISRLKIILKCIWYIFIQTGKDLDEDADRKKIKEDMSKLFAQLDFLTYDTVVNQKEVCIKLLV